MTLATKNAAHPIRSEFCEFPSRNGTKIAAFIDYPPGEPKEPRFVVMSPKYGESKKNNLQLAYYLAANGLTVLRFDFTSHFGESEGNMLEFTLPESAQDIVAAFDFLEREFDVRQAVLVASSLSSLPAFQVAAQDNRVGHLVGVVPAVNFADSIARVYHDDIIGNYIQGRRYGVLDILGHDVDMDNFCAELIEANMHDLHGTLAALKRAECPITLLPAADDAWVAMEDIQEVASCNSRIQVRTIEGAMHEVRENRNAAETLLREVVGICRGYYRGGESENTDLAVPEKKVLFEQNRIERARLREARPPNQAEDEFWGKYLGKYRVMEKTFDYQEYLDLVGKLLGDLADGETLLDAGCGNGLLGVWVLRELMQRKATKFDTPPLYVGLDLTEPGLNDAVEKHAEVTRFLAKPGDSRSKMTPGLLYGQSDLDVFSFQDASLEGMLRFENDCFDKIACSLLLSYLKAPDRLVRILHRILRPGGKIIISSMKPFCDMSAIYRDFVEEKALKEDIESARELLRAAGAIKIKQEQGYYEFYSENELTGMLSRAGFRDCQCFSSLGNQANVAVATK